MRHVKISEVKKFSENRFNKLIPFKTEKSVTNVLCFKGGQELPLHKHEHSDEVFCVIEGKGIITVEDEQIQADPGTLIMVPANVIHGCKNTGGIEWVIMSVQSPPL